MKHKTSTLPIMLPMLDKIPPSMHLHVYCQNVYLTQFHVLPVDPGPVLLVYVLDCHPIMLQRSASIVYKPFSRLSGRTAGRRSGKGALVSVTPHHFSKISCMFSHREFFANKQVRAVRSRRVLRRRRSLFDKCSKTYGVFFLTDI